MLEDYNIYGGSQLRRDFRSHLVKFLLLSSWENRSRKKKKKKEGDRVRPPLELAPREKTAGGPREIPEGAGKDIYCKGEGRGSEEVIAIYGNNMQQ